jgi:hypothetical protein
MQKLKEVKMEDYLCLGVISYVHPVIVAIETMMMMMSTPDHIVQYHHNTFFWIVYCKGKSNNFWIGLTI